MRTKVVSLLLLALGSSAPQTLGAARPNIIFIMADDHAAHALSCYGSRINQTPQLDRIARDGVRFSNCFVVNSICTPSRAAILTGKYSHMNGVPVFNRFDGSQPHVAKYLQEAGYYTGMIGKWHLGSDPTGFDHWTILPGQGRYHNPEFLEPDGRRTIQGYATDVITDLAIDFIKNRPKDKPFFLMYHHKAPHREWSPDAKHAHLYDGVDVPEPATLRDDYATRTDAARETTMTVANDLTRRDLKLEPPADLKGRALRQWLNVKPTSVTVEVNGRERTLEGEALRNWKYQRYIKDYLRCVASIDDNVGRLLDYLDQNGLRENTAVIYTSDQGFFLGDHGWYDKRFMYEESLRMPFIMRWPGLIKPGSVQTAMALNIDFAPTFMEMAGLKVPADMQGRSLLPLLRGESPGDWRPSMYYRYYHDPGHHNTRAHYGVRTMTHKLIYFWKKDQWECYDLVNDPHELHNLYGDPAHAELVASLKKELARLKKEVKDDDQFADQQPSGGVDGPFNRPVKQTPRKAADSGAESATSPAPTAAGGWIDLYNGRDLSGWVQHGGKAGYRADGPDIVGEAVPNTPNSFLCTTRPFTNFVLELEFKPMTGLNSGVQIRSQVFDEPTVVEWAGKQIKIPAGRVHGYQVEIDPSARAWTGGIYDEGRRGWLQDLKNNEPARRAFRANDWNRFRIECRGDSIKTWLNGVPAADLEDSLTPAGFIALQVHGIGKKPETLEVRWRNLRLQELP